MAIVQISKIQQRSGNLVDLPQLDDAEFGWASDEKRLFIGKSTPNENIEVLTSYSNISFSQINGSDGGNFNISNAQSGQLLTYVSSTDTWENYTGNTSQLNGTKLQLGSVSNISMTGGAIGYVLETDGTGNLSWTPKGALYTPIRAISNANPMVMTVANSVPYTNNTVVTISGVLGTNANSIVNGKSFYLQLANDFSTTGNVKLYTSSGNSSPADGTGLTATANTGTATSLTGSTGGSSNVGGSNTTVLFNNQNISDGSANLTFDFANNILTVSGNANVGNLNATTSVTTSRLISNIATGTAPLTVTSTTRVANLSVNYANVSDFEVVTAQTTGTFYPVFVNGNTTANYALGSNANISFNAATGNLSTILLSVTGNSNVGNLGTAGLIVATGNVTGGNLVTGGALSVTGNANVGNLGTAGLVVATGNVTGGNLVTGGVLSVTGNANVGNLGTAGLITATGNITGGNLHATRVTASILVSNVASGTAPLIVTSPTLVANLNADLLDGYNTSTSSAVNSVVVRDASANFGANVISANLFTGTLTTAAQPNITSVGTLTSLTVTGNANVGNLGTAQVLASANVTTPQFISNIATGTAPLVVASTTKVANLNADTLDGYDTATAATANTVAIRDANASLTANVFIGNIAGANVTGQVGNALVAGTVYTNAQPNITSVGTLTSVAVTGNVTAGNVYANSGTIGASLLTGTLTTAAQPNVTSVSTSFTNLTFANAQAITGNNLSLSTGANTNPGTITGNWTLTTGSRMQATYADLAEYYEADQSYEPGTVLAFGGTKEVTLAEDGTTRVAGVVSTDPAYVMNMKCPGEHIVALALQGRVPTKVRGTIRKGDLMVSGGNGFARPTTSPQMGTVIGKALQDFDGIEGVIEIAVGRL